MKRLKWMMAFMAMVLIGVLVPFAQTRKLASSQAQFSKVPFDLAANQLTPNYPGHSLVDLWGLMVERKKTMKQGEYETTPAWETRIAKLNAQPLTGTVRATSILAFKLRQTETSYSADSEALTITAKTADQIYDSMNKQGLSSFDSFLWGYSNQKSGSYIGANAFGVKRRVRVEKEMNYYLIFKSGIIGEAKMLTIQEVKPEKARAIRPHLRVLLVGVLTDPYIGGDKDETAATIDDPVKTSTFNFYAYFKPMAFWFYNFETGEVYYRADLKPIR